MALRIALPTLYLVLFSCALSSSFTLMWDRRVCLIADRSIITPVSTGLLSRFGMRDMTLETVVNHNYQLCKTFHLALYIWRRNHSHIFRKNISMIICNSWMWTISVHNLKVNISKKYNFVLFVFVFKLFQMDRHDVAGQIRYKFGYVITFGFHGNGQNQKFPSTYVSTILFEPNLTRI